MLFIYFYLCLDNDWPCIVQSLLNRNIFSTFVKVLPILLYVSVDLFFYSFFSFPEKGLATLIWK